MTRGGVALAASALLASGAYVGSPYWTVHELEAAAHSKTSAAVVRYFDLPAIRESMRTALKDASAREGGKLANNPFGELGEILEASIADKVVGELIEPDSLRDMIAFGTPGSVKHNEKLAFAAIDGEYIGLDEYRLNVQRPESYGQFRLKLERRGLIAWKVVEIEFVPEAAHGVKQADVSAVDTLPVPTPRARPQVTPVTAPAQAPANPSATESDGYDCADQPPRKSTKSLDGGFTYVQVCRATTSDEIIQIRKSDGQRRVVTSGNSLAVIRSGPWRGMLLVAKHKYKTGGGSFDATWVIRPDGKEMFQIPGTEDGDDEQVQSWLRNNGWTAD